MSVVALSEFDPLVRALQAGDLQAIFLPGHGMLCASLTHRGDELLGRVEDIPAMAKAGRTCGIPLLYPWANRLAGTSYRAAGQTVHLDLSSPLLNLDANSLPMHGIPWSRLVWQASAESSDTLNGELTWRSDELLAVFPFPHYLTLTAHLEPTRLTIETTIRPSSAQPIPVCFGFHPYLKLPGVERVAWQAEIPAMQHLELDERQIPNGRETRFQGLDGPLGNITFDDGYVLSEDREQFTVEAGGRRITITFLESFPFAQLFAPPGQNYIAIEPMTAPANALISGNGLRVVMPGDSFRAAFSIEVRPT